MDTAAGELRQKRPRIYQQGNLLDGRYRLAGGREVALIVPYYDTRQPLLIDPELLFAKQVGGGGYYSQVLGVAVDSQGNTYVTGQNAEPEFGGAFASYKVFVTKLDPTGQWIRRAAPM